MIYDVIIIGGGPAGVAALVYAARKKLKTLLITESFGGQSIVSDDIENWIGEKHIAGIELAKKLEEHARSFSEVVEIKSPEKAIQVKDIKCSESHRVCDFAVKTDKSNVYTGKALILASGARHRRLGVPGEETFQGKGISYCSTCDAPIFRNKAVAVIGGGNAGLEAVVDLFPYASKIYLLQLGSKLTGDPATQEEIKKNQKVTIFLNAETQGITGDKFVTGIKYKDSKTGQVKELKVGGVFIEIGSVPNSEIVKGLVKLDKWGQVITNSKHSSTSHPGIFAAGDVTDDMYKQNNISAGDGVRAALAAYFYISQREKQTPAAG